MRFITNKLYLSMQFYFRFSDKPYEKYVECILRSSENTRKLLLCNSSNSYGVSLTIQQAHSKNFNAAFCDDIHFYETVCKIALDCDGNLRELDEDIYYKLQSLAQKHELLEKEAFDFVNNSSENIYNGDFSSDLKELSRRRCHDDVILSIEFNKPHVILYIYHAGIVLVYDFTVSNHTLCKDLDNYIGKTILYEELFQNEVSTYEYNILMCNGLLGKELEDISIMFTEVKVNNRVAYEDEINYIKRHSEEFRKRLSI